VLTYRTGINQNDTTFKSTFPYIQTPWPGTNNCDCDDEMQTMSRNEAAAPPSMRTALASTSKLGVAAPEVFLSSTPNPASANNTIRYRVETPSQIRIVVMDGQGRQVRELVNKKQEAGTYTVDWRTANLSSGVYFITVIKDGNKNQTLKMIKE
jgi:hypothetical protein